MAQKIEDKVKIEVPVKSCISKNMPSTCLASFHSAILAYFAFFSRMGGNGQKL